MNVILLEKTGRLGNLGDKVSVKPGYARNFLIPQGKAVMATASNTEKFEASRAEFEKNAHDRLQAAQKRSETLNGISVTIAARAADEGRLYGSVGTKEIAHAITEHGIAVEKSEVRLPNGTLHNVGEFEVNVQLHSDIMVVVKINIIPEA